MSSILVCTEEILGCHTPVLITCINAGKKCSPGVTGQRLLFACLNLFVPDACNMLLTIYDEAFKEAAVTLLYEKEEFCMIYMYTPELSKNIKNRVSCKRGLYASAVGRNIISLSDNTVHSKDIPSNPCSVL